MKKLELEYMGSETEALPGEIIEEEIAIEAPPEHGQLTGGSQADE